MSLLASLPGIVAHCLEEYNRVQAEQDVPAFRTAEHMGPASENRLILGDNLDWLRLAAANKQENQLAFIYIDPPFYSKSDYRAEVRITSGGNKITGVQSDAYQDRWGSGMEGFLTMLTLRLLYMKELLTEHGGIVVHLDWRAVHYVKVIMDELFGHQRFVNEIIWTYKSGGASSRSFAKKHDTLLYYAAGKNHYFNPRKEKSYNRNFLPYRFRGVKEYKDELGWYTMVNQRDVFDVSMVGRTSGERTGYATQKPERLLEILLESCTKPGDVCADFFGGSGTLAATAHRMGRQFVSCDNSPLAMAVTRKRLVTSGAPFVYCVSEKEQKSQCAEFLADVKVQSTASDRVAVNIKLARYDRDCDALPVSEEDQMTVKELQKFDPLALVDYWCIDPDYDGKNFRSVQWYVRRQDGFLDEEAIFLATPGSCAAIKAYDAFGGYGLFEIHL